VTQHGIGELGDSRACTVVSHKSVGFHGKALAFNHVAYVFYFAGKWLFVHRRVLRRLRLN